MIVLCSDIQLYNYQNWSKVMPDGKNSRFDEGLRCLYTAANAAKGGYLFIAGDLFEDRHSIDIDILHHLSEWIEFANETCEHVFILCGNHDQFYRSGKVHSLSILKRTNITILDTGGRLTIDGYEIDYYPFTTNPQELIDFIKNSRPKIDGEKKIGVFHCSVMGATMDGGTIDEHGITPAQIKSDYDYIFLGHYHRPQTIDGNIHYIGSPYQIHFGDSCGDKRILVLDNDLLTEIPMQGPQFLYVDYEGLKKADPKNFYRVKCNRDQMLRMSREYPNLNLEPILYSDKEDFVPEEVEDEEFVVDLNKSIEDYFNSSGAGHLIETAKERINP